VGGTIIFPTEESLVYCASKLSKLSDREFILESDADESVPASIRRSSSSSSSYSSSVKSKYENDPLL
jgi:hypothetical protein